MKSKAFSLIELLIVISIITVLVAIVIPVLGFSRQLAKAAKCSANIKQHTVSMIEYESRNGTFPHSFRLTTVTATPPGGYLGNMAYTTPGWWWLNYITNASSVDIKRSSALWCPSRKISADIFKYDPLIGNYGANESICKSWYGSVDNSEFNGSPLSITDISSPGRTLLIVDSGYGVINWHHVTNSPPRPLGKTMFDRSYLPGLSMNNDRNVHSGQEDDAINGRHMKKEVNVGFVDGHVSRDKAEDLFVEKNDDCYKNLTPLWKPK